MLPISKTIKWFLVLVLVTSSLVTFYVGRSKATDQTVTCSESGCSGISGALFQENKLLPLVTISRTVTATNNYPEVRQFAVQVSDTNFTDTIPKLAEALVIKIIPEGSTVPLYGPVTIEHWRQDGYTLLSTIPAGGTQKYQFVVTLADVGNEYQGKNLQFDMSVGFETVFPAQNPSTNPSVGGASFSNPSAPVCSASAPVNAPIVTALTAGPNAVLLQWTLVSPATHYMVQYGTGGIWLYGNPNVGITSSYIVGSLSGGTPYLFRVAAVNDCAPGPWSGSVIAQAPGIVLATQAPPGFQQVLGVQDISSPSAKPRVLGVSENICESTIPWWIPLLLQFIFGFVILMRFPHRAFSWISIFALGVISQLIHNSIGCNCVDNFWCERYIWINISETLLLSFGSWRFPSQKK